ncbi:uncharacterized protein Triagg1_3645 [Trichoderma aggressivum f. europaeum]|uniref:Rossmann-fold NAD(P)(+)-binding protein n=1 Tax=Trichoderma aggressivum f. europaeum TaxID=173218 RepID=A0AAE1J9T5_9HYPO|nr:hypothetical protein Triagg1_3645 [Trichoderma aggressivum f. europaeum]
MSADLIERTTRLHALDLEYQQNRHKTDLISRDEDARRLQLRVLLLRDENTRLQDKCAAKDEEIKALSQDGDRLRVELDGFKAQSQPEDARTKDDAIEADDSAVGHIQNHDNRTLLANKLKADTKSSETHMQDLSKALDENMALTKELQQLRPEMELLKQQVTNYEKMLSEQRKTELASKKQSKPGRSNDESENMSELRAALDKVTEKLAEEERQRESTKSYHRKELEESERQNDKLEQRISKLEKKLKDSQKELRDVRKELKAPQPSSKEDESEGGNTSNNQEATAKPRAKDERLSRRNKRAIEQAAVGEKSAFSITPFLNKTKDTTAKETNGLGLTLDDVLAQPGVDDASPLVMANKSSDAKPIIAPDAELETTTPLRPREKLKAKKKANTTTAATTTATITAEDEDHLSKLTASVRKIARVRPDDTKDEETSKDVDSDDTAPSKRKKPHEPATTDPGSVFEHKKRKRKLLNKTNDIILEEDETVEGVPPVETPAGRPRRMKSSATSAFNSQTGTKPFSPLKRHKRGVNASFLA